jgi:hypothetical protein
MGDDWWCRRAKAKADLFSNFVQAAGKGNTPYDDAVLVVGTDTPTTYVNPNPTTEITTIGDLAKYLVVLLKFVARDNFRISVWGEGGAEFASSLVEPHENRVSFCATPHGNTNEYQVFFYPDSNTIETMIMPMKTALNNRIWIVNEDGTVFSV